MNVQQKPGPFLCLGCRSFVTGTESGHCPKCGLVPPRAVLARSVEPAVAVVHPSDLWDLLRRIDSRIVLLVALNVVWICVHFFYK